MSRRQRSQKPKVKPEDANLGRFAGSSDEEEEDDEPVLEPKEQLGVDHVDADDEGMASGSASASESEAEEYAPMAKITEGGEEEAEEMMEEADSENEFEDDPASKMANAMAKILGTVAPQQSVILGKTKTPLQKMQQKEKEEELEMKEKRQANRERNLAALHIPLSVATTNTIEDGHLSVTQELEQERLHRRVATRGVVALFNAISQHQKGTREVRIVRLSNRFVVVHYCHCHAFSEIMWYSFIASFHLLCLFFIFRRTLFPQNNERRLSNLPNTTLWIKLRQRQHPRMVTKREMNLNRKRPNRNPNGMP
jgi:hypothetical protein